MERSTKKVTALVLAAFVFVGANIVKSYDNTTDFKRDVNRFIASTFAGNSYYTPKGTGFGEFNPNATTYFVHKNNNGKMIISPKKQVNDYKCLGIYKHSGLDETLFYYEIISTYGSVDEESIFVEVSYSDLNKKNHPLNYVEDVTLIDEYSPDDVSVNLPDESIIKI